MGAASGATDIHHMGSFYDSFTGRFHQIERNKKDEYSSLNGRLSRKVRLSYGIILDM